MSTKDKMMTIGEIAKSLGITRRIIINYENHGLISADYRGEKDSGYRYYSMDTLVRIRTIRNFQNFGLTLDEIKGYLDGSTGLAPALKRLEGLRDELNLNIDKIRERMNSDADFEITIAELPSQTVYHYAMRDDTIEAKTNHLRDIAYKAISNHGMDISKRLYFIEYDIDDPNLITYIASVPEGSKGDNIIEIPKQRAISCYHHGAYSELAAVRDKLIEYANEHNIAITGRVRHSYLEGPPQHQDPRNFITQVAVIIDELGEIYK